MAVRLTEAHVILSAVYHTTTHAATSLASELCTTHCYPVTEDNTGWKDGTICTKYNICVLYTCTISCHAALGIITHLLANADVSLFLK